MKILRTAGNHGKEGIRNKRKKDTYEQKLLVPVVQYNIFKTHPLFKVTNLFDELYNSFYYEYRDESDEYIC